MVVKLTEDVERLSGGVFEQFGYAVMPLLHPGRWEHRGTTLDAAARGYTVDTSSNGAAFVGEMSSQADYFEDMSKADADLEHVLNLHPQAKSIWLLASRVATASQTTAMANAASAFRVKHPSVDNVEILDARAIATEIYSHLGKKDLVRTLSGALPTIERLADEHAFSHAIPTILALIARPKLETAIRMMLDARSCVILQGMSGAGKTALAARIAMLDRDSYDNVVWVDAREIARISALSNVDVTRSGLVHNVKTLLAQERVLLVLDDPGFALNELEALPHGDSKILVTCQAATGPDVIHVSDVEEVEAAAILSDEVLEPCSVEIAAKVRQAVGGHALMLRALNRLAKVRGWQAVERCLSTGGFAGVEDERNHKILRRVLRHQAEELTEELALVRWCDAPRFHVEVAQLVSMFAVENLEKRGFLAATSPGYVRIHDLVFKAIVAEVSISEAQATRLAQGMAALIREESATDRLLLQRLARTHSGLFKRLALDGAHAAAFVYMVALARNGEDSITILGDPLEAAKALEERQSLESCALEIRSAIETVEALNTLRGDHRSKEEARAGLERDVTALTLLLQHDGLSGEQRKMLRHHYAKMLVRLGREPEAQTIFISTCQELGAEAVSSLDQIPTPSQPQRMASPLFRGIQTQLARAVLRWLDLDADEVLVCEREEDLDRLLASETELSVVAEQVKDLTGRVSARDQCVREAIANFAIAFRYYNEQRIRCSFVFTTTAGLGDQKLDSFLQIDVLDTWRNYLQSSDATLLSNAVKALETRYRTGHSESDARRRAEVAAAHAYLDQGLWPRFLGAVCWHFDASPYAELRDQALQRIQHEPRFRSAPGDLLFARLMGEVLERSARPNLQDRALTASDLTMLAALTRGQLEAWVANHQLAGRLGSLEGEVADIHALLVQLLTAEAAERPDPRFVEDQLGRTPVFPDIYVLQPYEDGSSPYTDHRSYEYLRAWFYSPSLELASIEQSDEDDFVERIRNAFLEDRSADVDDRGANLVSVGHRGHDLRFHRRWVRWTMGTIAMATTVREWRPGRCDGYSLADVAIDVARFLGLCATLVPVNAEIHLRLGLDPGRLRPFLDPADDIARGRLQAAVRGVSGITRPIVERSFERFYTGSVTRELIVTESHRLAAEFVGGCTKGFHGARVDTSKLAQSIPELIAAHQRAFSM